MDTRAHMGIEVKDLNQSIASYSKLFQSVATKERADYTNFR